MKAQNANSQRLSPKTCKEITDLLSNYLNNSLQPQVRRQLEEHLKMCPDCVAFLKTFRKTVSVAHALRAEAMPKNVRRNILAFLQSRARARATRT
jgi:predicted anti-sigma-YlaC factor YlaD